MSAAPLLPEDEPVSMPSAPTVHGGDPDAIGRIDHYDLLRKLGGGGFGVVYLARDSVSGVEVAIKTLHPLLKHNAEEMDLLREKFRLVHGLTHPNIAKALVIHLVREINVWDDDARAELKLSPGDSVMVMDYAPGVTLSKWRRQFPGGVVPFDLALEVGRQVAEALDYAHSERIVHRDVKPSNVMVETVAAEPRPLDHGQGASRSLSAPTLRVRILDFGLAAEIRSSMSRVSTESGDTSGTRPYMAPEQWLGRKQDGRTDQYALACVLYELLSGAPPFAGVFETGDPAIMANAVASQTPEEVETLAPAANSALLRALSKAPKDRFSSCVALVESMDGPQGQTRSDPPKLFLSATLNGVEVEGASLSLWGKTIELPAKLELDPGIDFGPAEASAVAEDGTRYIGRIQPFPVDWTGERKLDIPLVRHAEAAPGGARRPRRAVALASSAALLAAVVGVLLTQSPRSPVTPPREDDSHAESAESAEVGGTSRPGAPRRIDLGGGVSLEMVACPGIATDFWMGKYEVTQEQWQRVMGGNPSHFKGDMNPVEDVSWNACQKFMQKLNALPSAKASGLTFRLPKEAEWEMACRAGATGEYCRLEDGTEISVETLGRVAWFDSNSNQQTHPVGQKEPNAWGLYDMHGNVWEWTETADGEFRVNRGGGWGNSARYCESSPRYWFSPSDRFSDLGFRLCASGRAD